MLRKILYYSNIFGYLWTLCICLFTVPMPRWVQFGGIYLFVATWLVELFLDKRWRYKPGKEWIYYALQLAFFALAFIYWPWDGDVYFQHHAELRVPLLAFCLIGLFGINKCYSKAIIINTMVIASVCAILFVYSMTGWREALFSADRVTLIAECCTRYLSSHTRFDFFLISTLIGMWYLLFHADRQPALWQKIVYPLAALLILFMLLHSEGRSGFFMGIAVVGLMTVIELYRLNKWLSVAVSVTALAALVVLSAHHPRISTETMHYDLRYSYWQAASEMIKEKPVLGYGMSRAQEVFDQTCPKYVSADDCYFWEVRQRHFVDSHNQYLQAMLEFGILGLVLLLAIYVSPLVLCWGKREWWLVLFFTLISMGQSMVDMFLTGQFGILYGLLFLMSLKMPNDYSSYLSKSPRK